MAQKIIEVTPPTYACLVALGESADTWFVYTVFVFSELQAQLQQIDTPRFDKVTGGAGRRQSKL